MLRAPAEKDNLLDKRDEFLISVDVAAEAL